MRDNLEGFRAMPVWRRALYVLGFVLVTLAVRVVLALVGGDEIDWGPIIVSSLASGLGAAIVLFFFARQR